MPKHDELPILEEHDLHGPYYPDPRWAKGVKPDFWVPTAIDRPCKITSVLVNRLPVDQIPLDDPDVIAACLDGLFVDHNQPGEYLSLPSITRLREFAGQWLTSDEYTSEVFRGNAERRVLNLVQALQKGIKKDLRLQQRTFNKTITAHGGLYVVTESHDTRPAPDVMEKRQAFFASSLAAVALHLGPDPDQFAFEPVVWSRQSGCVGLLPRELSITGVYQEKK